MAALRILGGVVAILVGAFSLLVAIVSIDDLKSGGAGELSPVAAAGVIFFFSVIAATAGWLAKRLLRAPRKRSRTDEEKERAVLTLAAQEKGRVTVSEVAMRCFLSLAESETLLRRLVSKGVAELLFTDSGGEVFVFKGTITSEEKSAAREPWEL